VLLKFHILLKRWNTYDIRYLLRGREGALILCPWSPSDPMFLSESSPSLPPISPICKVLLAARCIWNNWSIVTAWLDLNHSCIRVASIWGCCGVVSRSNIEGDSDVWFCREITNSLSLAAVKASVISSMDKDSVPGWFTKLGRSCSSLWTNSEARRIELITSSIVSRSF